MRVRVDLPGLGVEYGYMALQVVELDGRGWTYLGWEFSIGTLYWRWKTWMRV